MKNKIVQASKRSVRPEFSTPEELDELLLEGKRSGALVDVTPEFWSEIRTEIYSEYPTKRKAS